MELIDNEISTPTLCLNMIVKNESKIITRLFDSVISIIDSYCICDTGSTDNTIEIIEKYFAEKNIPGKIVQEPFKNFSHNRTFALNACVGMSDYVILLDADMILQVKNFDKKILYSADYFMILQGSEAFYYQNTRIVKNNGLFKYTGVTHEYVDVPGGSNSLIINKSQLFINDIGDGGCKSNKFERDVKLLLDGLKDEPNNPRYYFYLGNSYHDLGKYDEAINSYKKRIEIGGWKEEVWYSYYKIGGCYMKLGQMSNALWYWMEGFNYYPDRLEGLYELIKYYRLEGKNKLAFSIFNMCKEFLDKNINRDGYLFLNNDVYRIHLYYEYTIIAAYNGITNINNEIVKIFNIGYNNEVNNLLSNMKFYKDVLPCKQKIILDNSIISNIDDNNTILTSSSSCLIKNIDNDGYKLNVRYVNYLINNSGNYLNCDKHIITANKCFDLNNDLKVQTDTLMEIVFDGRRYIGIEDVRLYHDKYSDDLIYIGTGFHKNNTIGVVSGKYDLNTKMLEVNELKQHFKESGCEKNWVFVDYKDETHIIYDWYPLKICKLHEDNTISVSETKEMPKLFSRVRGSTCGFNYAKTVDKSSDGNVQIDIKETEIWFVGHIVSYENPRHYYHIISVFDDNMNLLRYSAPFKFEGEPIEYCLSIVVEDERVLMNYSTWDRTTRIGVYDKTYIDSILKYN
jgi:glycosyltransferase involved in cell wall biosynthesis